VLKLFSASKLYNCPHVIRLAAIRPVLCCQSTADVAVFVVFIAVIDATRRD